MISSLIEEAPPGGKTIPLASGFEPPVRLGLAKPTLAAEEPSANEDDVYLFPATLAQRRFWLLDQLVRGGNPALNIPLALRLRGQLDHAALERAFNEILRRHESLRTTFHSERGQLFQAIAPTLTMTVPVVDVQDFPSAERAQVPDHLLSEEMNRPFDLARGPLLRARLVRLAPEHHLLLFPLHHIVADGWSNGVLTRELGAVYAAFAQGKPSPLPDLPVQFADFAQWQQNVLAEGGFDAQLDYWRHRLAGELPVLDLPVDRPRRPWRGQAAPGGVCSRRLPGELSRAVKALAVREGASTFMVMLAAFTVLLNRYSGGQEDVLIGTSSANRDHLEVENLIGLFVNPLLLRVNLSGTPTFRELLGRVRRVVLDAFEHSDAPFEKLVEELQPRRLQVNFLYQNAFVQPARLPELELTPLPTGSPGALFEWMAAAVEDPEGITVSIEYNADLFDASTIDRVLASYEQLLGAVTTAAGPEVLVSHLPINPPVVTAGAMRLQVEHRRLPATSLPWIERAFESASEDGLVPSRPGVTLRLLDGHAQPVPMGVAGEIVVDGPGRNSLKTGELGYQWSDGILEWVGPMERQHRINGLRVNSRAVEIALRAHPHVRDAVILWRADQSRTPRMVAYFVSDGAPAALVSPTQLRVFLQETLPEETIPAAFVWLEAFPLTADGRLDETRLSDAATEAGPPVEEGNVVPYLTLHHQIIDIWRELLGARSINIRDDFFALGGNSLLAMRMLYQIEQSFGRTLLPATLFRRATVEHLADEILNHDDGEVSPEVVRVQEQGAKTPLFFLHGDISGGGFYCRKLSRDLGTDQPFYALPPVELSNPLEDRPSVEEMAAAHVRTIRSVRPHGPYVIGGFCLGGLISYEVARQLVELGETVERLLVIDAEPENRRLETLRRMTERWARARGLDANRQLYFFCRWHYWLARMDRFRRLTAKERAAAFWRRLLGRGAQTSTPPALPAPTVEESATSWFDPRLDVPLVFLWAMGGYEAKPYLGRMTLLLSSDLLGGVKSGGNPTRAWQRLVPRLETETLAGRHLECITAHVAGLARTIRRCLESSPE